MDEERKSTINSKAAYNKLKTIVSTNSNFLFSNLIERKSKTKYVKRQSRNRRYGSKESRVSISTYNNTIEFWIL